MADHLANKKEGYNLTKQLFSDLVRMRYNWTLPRLPSVKLQKVFKTTQQTGTRLNLTYVLEGSGKQVKQHFLM